MSNDTTDIIRGQGQEPDPFDGRSPKTGQKIRQYRLHRSIGKGGMGEVFEAWDESLDRRLAIKVIRKDGLIHRDAMKRFQQEARFLSQLEQPNICRIYEYFEEQQTGFIVLEFVEGQSLQQWGKQVDHRKKLQAAIQITGVLASTHAQSIIHRDLKPENVMVQTDGQVKVLDFGIAKTLSEKEPKTQPPSPNPQTDLQLTQPGSFVGTPKYMSPEQAKGERVTAASDMYALGLLFQVLFTGELPYEKGIPLHHLVFLVMEGKSRPLPNRMDSQLKTLIEELKSAKPGDRPDAVTTLARLKRIEDRPRRRAKAILAGTLAAILMLAVLISSLGLRKAKKAEHKAIESGERERAVNEFLQTMLASADPNVGNRDVKVIDLLQTAQENLAQKNFHPLVTASLQHAIGVTYTGLGSYPEGEACLLAALEARKASLGDHHPETLKSEMYLASVWEKMGAYEKAQKLTEINIQHWMEAGPQQVRFMMKAKLQLGLIQKRMGQLAQAHQTIQDVYRYWEEQKGRDDKETLEAAEALANMLLAEGHHGEAIAITSKNVAILKRQKGNMHPDSINAVQSLAEAYWEQKDFMQAEGLFLEVLNLRKQRYGPNHHLTLVAMQNLANTYSDAGKLEEAGTLLQEILLAQSALLGADHLNTMQVANNLGVLFIRKKDWKEGVRVFRALTERKRRILGPLHPSTMKTENNLAFTLSNLGENQEAEAIMRDLVRRKTEALGENHPSTLTSRQILAMILFQAGHKQESQMILEDVLTRREAHLGKDHPDVEKTRKRLHQVRGE